MRQKCESELGRRLSSRLFSLCGHAYNIMPCLEMKRMTMIEELKSILAAASGLNFSFPTADTWKWKWKEYVRSTVYLHTSLRHGEIVVSLFSPLPYDPYEACLAIRCHTWIDCCAINEVSPLLSELDRSLGQSVKRYHLKRLGTLDDGRSSDASDRPFSSNMTLRILPC